MARRTVDNCIMTESLKKKTSIVGNQDRNNASFREPDTLTQTTLPINAIEQNKREEKRY